MVKKGETFEFEIRKAIPEAYSRKKKHRVHVEAAKRRPWSHFML